jgi:UPF0271 protein
MPFLNLDAGERADETDEFWALADLLSCACGGHAGDAASMDRVAAFCARSSVKLGAHPSYPDRTGFGRMSPLEGSSGAARATRAREVAAIVAPAVFEQCRALSAAARRRGVTVVAVKPHGALYHDATAHPVIAEVIVRAAVDALGRDVVVIGPPRGALHDEARRRHLSYAREGFADRRLRADGTIVPRNEPGAVIDDPAAAVDQARAVAASVDTICVHGDTPGADRIARAVREALGNWTATPRSAP